ncbi:hypothetical protein [Roseicitreum antarcticum]|uniref:Uncharacterized protein n=1 Tax=Roseicitreum antarcticum TaxID=564137 RepID=A0A1H3B2E8_9RHOB|nr:hypothetical protein [Roseicitreum antarcticum]SDX35219.1 hypothetical protein SAMN04488238_107200 [Roseicitreum antarcticum]
MVRAEIAARLHRWREVLAGGAIVLAGLWLGSLGGVLMVAIGLAVGLAGVAAAITGLRRMRFQRADTGPGIVQVVEGQISYFGPETGGFVALSDLTALHLCDAGRTWLLTAPPGAALTIPAGAQGADQLFDLFASLPGLDMSALLRAVNHADPAGDQLIWQRRHLTALN